LTGAEDRLGVSTLLSGGWMKSEYGSQAPAVGL
jgi:hypothetical protein